MKLNVNSLPEEDTSQSMSAMTDVVFLLLIFFVVTTGAWVKTTLIDTALPQDSGGAGPNMLKSIQLEISAYDEQQPTLLYRVNGIPHTKDQLAQTLQQFGSYSRESDIMIQCDNESRHGELVYLLSLLHANHLDKIQILKPVE
ncbi:MAG: hypothetical protein CMJ19_14010 [Phycisphaeraceae bacterium]|nr:hypothetical protein [Phycisphaeraceae bacterium]